MSRREMEKNERDKRSKSRETHLETITFSIIGSFSGKKEFLPTAGLKANIIDTCESGIGIFTDSRLEPGMLVKFNSMNDPNVGIVIWTIDLGGRFRSGLRFDYGNYV